MIRSDCLEGEDYPILRPPSHSSDIQGLPYIRDSIVEPRQNTQGGHGRSSWADRDLNDSNSIIGITASIQRSDTLNSYQSEAIKDWAVAGPSDLSRQYTTVIKQIGNFESRTPLELHAQEAEDFEDDERRFINPALLSHLAVQLRDKVPRGVHVKGSIPYPRAFTGKDIVVSMFQFQVTKFDVILNAYSQLSTPLSNKE